MATEKRISPAQFVREVRAEARKVIWPKRKEVGISTLMVLAMTAVMGLFFLVVDQVIAWLVQLIIG